MPTFEPLTGKDREEHAAIVRGYLNGPCYLFALMLNKGLGWPLAGLVGKDGTIHHAFARVPESDYFFDARGRVTRSTVSSEIDGLPQKWEIQDVEPVELRTRLLVHMRSEKELDAMIESVLPRAQLLWPGLPWKEGPRLRVQKFLEELEELCAKHRLYIRAPYPTAQPIIGEMHGDEGGYRFSSFGTGREHFFDRIL